MSSHKVSNPLNQSRMRIMEEDIRLMRIKVAERADGEFLQRFAQLLAQTVLLGETVRLEFIPPGYNVQPHAQQSGDGCIEYAEHDHTEMEGWVLATQRLRQMHITRLRSAQSQGEEEEHETGVENRYQQHQQGMFMLVMAYLVRQDRHDLLRVERVHQRVVEHDALLRAQARKVGVRLGRALRTVDHIEVIQPEIHLFAELLDGGTQLALLQRSLFVEERHDQVGVEHQHEDGDAGHHRPSDQPEVGARLVVDEHEQRQNTATEQHGKQPALHRIRGEKGRRHLIEAETLLDLEGMVNTERDVQHFVGEIEDAEEDQRDHDGVLRKAPRDVVHEGETEEEEHQHHDDEGEESGDHAELLIGQEILLLLLVRLSVVKVFHLVRKRLAHLAIVQVIQVPLQGEVEHQDSDDNPK